MLCFDKLDTATVDMAGLYDGYYAEILLIKEAFYVTTNQELNRHGCTTIAPAITVPQLLKRLHTKTVNLLEC